MRTYIFLLLSFISIRASAQFNRFVVLDATANFFSGQKALGYDDAGVGAGAQVSFPGYSRWEVTVAANADHFFGDKVYRLPNEGRVNKGPAVYSLFGGPQYFVLHRLAVSVTAGPAWYSVHTKGFAASTGYQLGATGYLGKRRRFILKLLFAEIPREEGNIRYAGMGLGYRFL